MLPSPGIPNTSVLGTSLALDGATLVINGQAVGGRDTLLVYESTELGWVLAQTLEAPLGAREFGERFALEGDALLVPAIGPHRLFGYERTGGLFGLASTLSDDGLPGVTTDLVLAGDLAFIGRFDGGVSVLRANASIGSIVTGCAASTNSAGGIAMLHVSGSTSHTEEQLGLYASSQQLGGLGATGLFLVSPNAGSTSIDAGTLCLGRPLMRLGAGTFTPASIPLLPDLRALSLDGSSAWGWASPGSTLHFQYWYLDANSAAGSSFSNSVAVTFCGR
ncbi:MAG: hypothetical protein R3F49_08115 [Planctomycetota bacterium]